MNHCRVLLLLMTQIISSAALAEISTPKTDPCDPQYHYQLKRVFEVGGRQGVATEGQYYYVSGDNALFKYSKDGTLLLKNEQPFAAFKQPGQQMGDIEYYQGSILASCTTPGKHIQIGFYDAENLKYQRAIAGAPASGQVDSSGLTVDPHHQHIWLSEWSTGRYLYQYDLNSGHYLGKLQLQPVPQYQQGLLYWQDQLYITVDDGRADEQEADHLYRLKLHPSATAAQVRLEKVFTEFKRPGEIEGLTIDAKTQELLVLFNHGAQIVAGVAQGFYPDYDREIHEIYVFKMTTP
ncbi:MAG: hypothetical protein SVR94_02555 [Pseudomonadota bacterium]|nr:hypothetical protein [Pseudomonadota bacterium]